MSSQRHLSTRGGGRAPEAGETDDRGAHCIMCGCVVQPTPGEMTPAHGWHCDRCARDKLRHSYGIRVLHGDARSMLELEERTAAILRDCPGWDRWPSALNAAHAELGR